MNKIEKAICAFFDKVGCTYVNSNDVEIAWLKGDSICVSGFWHEDDKENVELVLMTVCDNYPEFIQTFEISDNIRASVEVITTETLMRLYQAGEGIIACSIDGVNAPTLEFDKRDNKIIAIDELQIEHEVDRELKSPEEFISFTKAFFEKNKHLTKRLIFKNGRWQSLVQIAN